ncbi:hypothetical protein O9G_006409 [Rozella allomycis CSF55]|uniref:Uncharacterized protein n=1 Tax=Rozella allomycis (strain CSF55) TaxID=988480 RepID=A0A075B0Z1_ROZAC|nr:hypothetical protein O9G_006409 [Rozella allomycis CSF55]|eukprot:EPZ36063.1 hypothetical protein O9G_006409 [Rozella allomycis CSF55]
MELLANPGNNKLPVVCINEKECFKLPLGKDVIWAETKEDLIHKLLVKFIGYHILCAFERLSF